jgi:hypothetical protein
LTGENSFASQQLFRRSAAISPVGEFFAGQQFCQSTAFSLAGEFFATRQLAGEFSTVGSVLPVGCFFAGWRVFRRSTVLPVGRVFAGWQLFRRLAAFRRPASFSPVGSCFAIRQMFCQSAAVSPDCRFFCRKQTQMPWPPTMAFYDQSPSKDPDAMATNNGFL